MENIPVSSMMSKVVVSVEMDDTLEIIKEIFDHTKFHHIVVGQEKLHGIISDRDLLKSLSPYLGTLAETSRDHASLNKKAHQIMTRHPITLGLDATMKDVLHIFNRHQISCIPIVDDDFHTVGMLSWRDVIKVLDKKLQSQED